MEKVVCRSSIRAVSQQEEKDETENICRGLMILTGQDRKSRRRANKKDESRENMKGICNPVKLSCHETTHRYQKSIIGKQLPGCSILWLWQRYAIHLIINELPKQHIRRPNDDERRPNNISE